MGDVYPKQGVIIIRGGLKNAFNWCVIDNLFTKCALLISIIFYSVIVKLKWKAQHNKG